MKINPVNSFHKNIRFHSKPQTPLQKEIIKDLISQGYLDKAIEHGATDEQIKALNNCDPKLSAAEIFTASKNTFENFIKYKTDNLKNGVISLGVYMSK